MREVEAGVEQKCTFCREELPKTQEEIESNVSGEGMELKAQSERGLQYGMYKIITELHIATFIYTVECLIIHPEAHSVQR